MHRSHEYLAKISNRDRQDGVFVHMLLKLKPGDIPSDVRQKAIDVLTEKYFVKNTIVIGGHPLRYEIGMDRESPSPCALIRRYRVASHQLSAGTMQASAKYYGPFDAHKISR